MKYRDKLKYSLRIEKTISTRKLMNKQIHKIDQNRRRRVRSRKKCLYLQKKPKVSNLLSNYLPGQSITPISSAMIDNAEARRRSKILRVRRKKKMKEEGEEVSARKEEGEEEGEGRNVWGCIGKKRKRGKMKEKGRIGE